MRLANLSVLFISTQLLSAMRILGEGQAFEYKYFYTLHSELTTLHSTLKWDISINTKLISPCHMLARVIFMYSIVSKMYIKNVGG